MVFLLPAALGSGRGAEGKVRLVILHTLSRETVLDEEGL